MGMNDTKVMSLRLSEDLAAEMASICRVDEVTISEGSERPSTDTSPPAVPTSVFRRGSRSDWKRICRPSNNSQGKAVNSSKSGVHRYAIGARSDSTKPARSGGCW